MVSLDLSKSSILLVDDIVFVRETVAKILNGLGYPKIYQASDGKQALMMLQSNKEIDFVISDFKMPVFNGLQLLKAVRSGAGLVDRALPIALLTNFSDKELVTMALELDATAFLIKPVSKGTLITRLQKMIELADDTSWLKPEAAYRSVKIMEESFQDVKDRKFDGAPPDARKGQGVLKRTTAIISSESGKAKKKPSKTIEGETTRVNSLEELPTNATLAEDIYLTDGRLFLPIGDRLTGRSVSLIKDMVELDRLKLGFLIVK